MGYFDDEPGTQRDEPDAQDSDVHDDSNNELSNTARDKTEESVLIFVLRLVLSHALQENFDVLEHHQMKNGQCKDPSVTHLLRANILTADMLLAS
jgi:hypothetical protein